MFQREFCVIVCERERGREREWEREREREMGGEREKEKEKESFVGTFSDFLLLPFSAFLRN